MIGEGWETVHNLLPATGVAIITDNNVFSLYGKKFPVFPVFSVDPGEESKKIGIVESLAGKLISAGIDRSGFILAIGGGVVSDIAGFLASIYLRGIRFGSVSTSLLSQVDASTGGKNGVNLGKFKNILGTFKQPEFVICDPEMLKTLSDEEYFSGLAELVKTAIIGDVKLFELIEDNTIKILNRQSEFMASLIKLAVDFKASVVTEDEKEAGVRRILNFGHTYGHAIELYGSFRHGYAVASGMQLATLFSEEKGYIKADDRRRITDLLNKFSLLRMHDIPDHLISDFIVHDKKKAGDGIYFVFTGGPGKAFTEKIAVDDVTEFYRRSKIRQL